MNAKQRRSNRQTALSLHIKVVPPPICPNCGGSGPHFTPPCFGGRGFFICDIPEERDRKWKERDEQDAIEFSNMVLTGTRLGEKYSKI